MTRAFVLIRTQTSETSEVIAMVRKIAGVIIADVTFGPYDVVAQVEAEGLDAVGRIIVREIRPLPGVIDTVTCLAVNPGS